MSDYLEHIEEACKIIMSEACNLDLERVKHKNLFKLKGEMYSIISKENDKLKRLLAEACEWLNRIPRIVCDPFGPSKELKQWYEEHKKQERNNEERKVVEGAMQEFFENKEEHK